MEIRLPLEIILQIVESLAPDPKSSIPVALPPNHQSTKTFLALLSTSRGIYPTARRLLYTHCMWINTPDRLLLLLRTLQDASAIDIVPHITSLYLHIFPIDRDVLDISRCSAIRDTLNAIRFNLRRFVIDLPMKALHGETDGLRLILRAGFLDLPALEEFCSLRDELPIYMGNSIPLNSGLDAYTDTYCWAYWPKLRTIALHNVDMGSELIDEWETFHDLSKISQIETIVLTRSHISRNWNFKREWKERFKREEDVRPVNFILVDVQSDHIELAGKGSWKPDDKVKIQQINVPTSDYGDENPVELCRKWIERRVLAGESVTQWT